MNDKHCLKNYLTELFNKRKDDSVESLEDIAKAESQIGESYHKRYLFELLQNARDAAKSNNHKGKVKFLLKENILYCANTGAPFSFRGIKSITRIGQSAKSGSEYIGHKGIGFKSVLELSNNLEIITKSGSIKFNRDDAINILNKQRKDNVIVSKLPVFCFPIFSETTIHDYPEFKSYDTLIKIPLSNDISSKEVIDQFEDDVKPEQLIFLGNMSQLVFESDEFHGMYTVKEEVNGSIVMNYTNDEKGKIWEKRYAVLSKRFVLDKETHGKLKKTEKEQHKINELIDIKVAFELNLDNKLVPREKSKLYLYYPLEELSGFNFLIHSYFSVSPDRKYLKKGSPINNLIFNELSGFLCNDVLGFLKRNHKTEIINALLFNEDLNFNLESFYKKIYTILRKKSFIYGNGKFFKPDFVKFCTSRAFELFGGKIGEYLLILDDKNTIRNWLQKFDITFLGKQVILEYSEEVCLFNINNPSFFTDFYSYLIVLTIDATDLAVMLE